MSSKVVAVLSSILVLVCLVAIPAKAAEDDAAPKYNTKDVMKKAMKGPLLKKVASGGASDEEKKELQASLNVPYFQIYKFPDFKIVKSQKMKHLSF